MILHSKYPIVIISFVGPKSIYKTDIELNYLAASLKGGLCKYNKSNKIYWIQVKKSSSITPIVRSRDTILLSHAFISELGLIAIWNGIVCVCEIQVNYE